MDEQRPLQHLVEAELAAEHIDSTREAKRSLVQHLLRSFAGFVLIGAGIAMLPLPGPGWLVIVVGLGLLPYRWAKRLTREIRRRVPGVPDEGRIPARTLVLWGVVIAAVSVVFGGAATAWVTESFGDPDRLFR